MTNLVPLTQSIPSCWTKRVQVSRREAPLPAAEWQKTRLSFPLVLCCDATTDTLPIGEEVPLAQSILPDLLITVVLDASGGGTLRTRPQSPPTHPIPQIPIGTLFITLEELTQLCSGGDVAFSVKQPSLGPSE